MNGQTIWCIYIYVCVCVCVCLAAQSCPILCDPMDCSWPGSSVHGMLQARILGWVAIPFSRGSSWPRTQTQVSCIASGFFTIWATREYFIYKKMPFAVTWMDLEIIILSQTDKYCEITYMWNLKKIQMNLFAKQK